MNAPAFQFYADDFLAGTMDLLPNEVGAYIRLLCYQWSKGHIPDDEARLSRIAGVERVGFCWVSVLEKFPAGDDGKRRNIRLEAERAKQQSYRDKQAKNGQKGGRPRKAKTQTEPKQNPSLSSGLSQTKANVNPNESSPSPSPVPSSKEEGIILGPEPSNQGLERKPTESDLLKIYEAYPRKKQRPAALKAIGKAVKKHGYEQVLERTQMFGAICDKPAQFIPYPASFFNSEEYNDDPETWKDHADHSRNNPQSFDRGQGTCNADVVNDYAGR